MRKHTNLFRLKKTDSERAVFVCLFSFPEILFNRRYSIKKISTISLVNVGIETRVRANNESRVIKYRIKCVRRSEICQGVFCYLNIGNEQFKIRAIVRIRAPPTDLNSKKFRSEERTWKADSQKEEKINITHMKFMRRTENIMRPRITDDTYTTYKGAIKNYIVPQIGKMYMSTLNQGYIRKLYNAVAEKYESVAKNVRTIMKTSLEYAFNKNVLATNPAKGINLPKKIKKTEYRVLKIDEKKTLTLPQVLRLIEASKETPIHMQILFAVLMGLRRSEINGLKYSDVDYIHRTLRVERQLGKKPNSKAEDCAPKMLTKQEIKTKTPAGVRELPIPDYVFEAILEERKTYEKNRRRRPKEFRDWNYICCSTYGNPRSKGFHQKYYKDLLKSLDLPDIHFHQLRNTYATILLKNSSNSKGVSHLLGHAKEIISVDVYGDRVERQLGKKPNSKA